ncbi:hypothetical protein Ahy_A03g010224 [Arachis hypogaea]|uniref:Uncharacterized protein n=1 Tax=Arachis hypogaea TaxID=3818 RepID=A0A445DLH3_ARAHY|nr:hypothetical protein Ahy_A03g010224 [Arachis hypogaea]
MVPNPKYVAPTAAPPPQPGSRLFASLEWTLPPPPSTQQRTISATLPPATNTTEPEFSHGSPPDASPPPPIVRMTIWPDGTSRQDSRLIRKIFDHSMARRLQQMLEDVREHSNHLTIWLCLYIKKLLYVHWEIDEGFKRRRLTNRANRTSARSSKYTGDFHED